MRAEAVRGAAGELYSDRVCPPAETVERLRPHWRALGITRLARQTGLDRIGIPVFSAIRPNALTLAASTGKGIDDDAAKASALMEALEYAVAENPEAKAILARAGDQADQMDVARLMPRGVNLPADRDLRWFAGQDLLTGASVTAPADALTIDHTRPGVAAIARSTNGLASGNTETEAIFHALCELVERDAATLFAFRDDKAVAAAAIDPARLSDPVLDRLSGRIEAAGFRLRLFDMTSTIGVPVFMAVIFEAGSPPSRHFDVAAGSGCHPVAARAAIRAVTEAAQTRVTTIAGARDDFDPARYRALMSEAAAVFCRGDAAPGRGRGPAAGLPAGTPLADLLTHMVTCLRRAGIETVGCFRLGGERFGVSVVRLIAPELEDAAANHNWRPGARAKRAMLGLS